MGILTAECDGCKKTITKPEICRGHWGQLLCLKCYLEGELEWFKTEREEAEETLQDTQKIINLTDKGINETKEKLDKINNQTGETN